MVSRRLLRIKVMQMLYAFFSTGEDNITQREKELFHSINKSYELYFYLFLLLTDIADYASERIEIAKQKRIPTFDDLNPNTKFIDNLVIQQIRESEQLKTYLSNNKLSWVNYPELIKSIYQNIKDSELYSSYMSSKDTSYENDRKFIGEILEKIVVENELMFQILEEQSIYWNDDLEFVVSMMIRTISTWKKHEQKGCQFMDLYKNDEDREFVRQLFRKTINKADESKNLIDRYTKNWDVERIAFMDYLIMQMAITEIMEFEDIPVRVSFNEYIEVAKFYSTRKSSVFINGIIDKIINTLKAENKIVKKGRGLIGEGS